MSYIDIVFAKTPDPNPDFRFVEVEDVSGASVEVGTWLQRPDGYWVLRIAQTAPIDPEPIIKALARAWQLGQTYWQQADSDSYRQQDKSDKTRAKYLSLVNEISTLLAASATPKDTP